MNEHAVPRLTTESLIALSIGHRVRPPPLLLLQLGFDKTADGAAEQFLSYLERGSRTLKVLRDELDPTEPVKEQLRSYIVAMSQAPVFVVLQRSDKLNSTVLYVGEESVVDHIDDYGNHRLIGTKDVELEVERFFGGFQLTNGSPITYPLADIESARSNSSEDPLVMALASSESIGYLSLVCNPSTAQSKLVRWCCADDRFFEIQNEEGTVTLTPVTSQNAAELVVGLLGAANQ